MAGLIVQATVDCYSEDEELTGFATMIGDNLAVPFETTVLGVTVTVRKIGCTGSGVVAICARGKHRQAIPVKARRAAGGEPAPAAGGRRPEALRRIRSDSGEGRTFTREELADAWGISE